MVPITVHAVISAPREELFDYVADLSNRVAFADHYMRDFHLTRPRSSGLGAGARFRLDVPGAKTFAESVIVEVERPRRLVEEGRMGRLGRTRWHSVWDLSPAGHDATRVELAVGTQPGTRVDSLRESLGARRWHRRQANAALSRLRRAFEERPERPLARATIAGYEPAKAPRFGA